MPINAQRFMVKIVKCTMLKDTKALHYGRPDNMRIIFFNTLPARIPLHNGHFALQSAQQLLNEHCELFTEQ